VEPSKYRVWEVPNYGIDEASRYLHIPKKTIRYWVIGEPGAAPLTAVYSRKPLLLSFKNLVELYVLESLRHIHNIGLRGIRRDVEELRREKPSKYPLADYQLATRGKKNKSRCLKASLFICATILIMTMWPKS
jgi:hypothetical protein